MLVKPLSVSLNVSLTPNSRICFQLKSRISKMRLFSEMRPFVMRLFAMRPMLIRPIITMRPLEMRLFAMLPLMMRPILAMRPLVM